MKHLYNELKAEYKEHRGTWPRASYFRAIGYMKDPNAPMPRRRAYGAYYAISEPGAFIYKNDYIAGSMLPLAINISDEERKKADDICEKIGNRWFGTNSDHFAPDYFKFVRIGIPGMMAEIDASIAKFENEPEKKSFCEDMKIAFSGFVKSVEQYAAKAAELKDCDGYDNERLAFIEKNCRELLVSAPTSFASALQLVWFAHLAFVYEDRYAMALGRIDQYLYPLFKNDIDAGIINENDAVALLANVFMKICEKRGVWDFDDVVNICIGGQSPDGTCDINRLSYCVLAAVGLCNLPGPNLSARIPHNCPDDFLDNCLKVIGTGLGYPALMNDDVNIAGLSRFNYAKEDVYNYCMVGCIENLLTGCQPPWSDNRFDPPHSLEYMFNHGKAKFHWLNGPDTGDISEITSMDDFMEKFEYQIADAVKGYVATVNGYNDLPDPENYTQPFLSCFCDCCIERGMDINMGGAKYPSVHGAAVMGIGTVADSLAAIEKTVFVDKSLTLQELKEALDCNFEGKENVRKLLLDAPKYGNNDDFVDKYAVWYVDFCAKEFDKYHTHDGGAFYILMAANTNNITAGEYTAATPDGRKEKEPLSDAASPSHGKDTRGATCTVNSITKPDYKVVSGGSVVNQKFSPSMFTDEKRPKLLSLVKTYFKKGGQEMQINATSRDVLKDAMEHPEKYPEMVVRVSGFSAIYITLDKATQLDILNRTQQE